MKLIKIVQSKTSQTFKYIMETDDQLITEFSYIDKNDGKDIICVPSQTMCHMGCKFCHAADYKGKIELRNLDYQEIVEVVKFIVMNRNLDGEGRTLLVSYMGIGEPLLNIKNVLESMVKIKRFHSMKYKVVRFALATCLPENRILDFADFTQEVKRHYLKVKLHLSLHFTNDEIRKEWMPQAFIIKPSLYLMGHYKNITGNPVEIHYTLIDGVNDSEEDALLLAKYLKYRDIVVKFLAFNEKPTLDAHASDSDKLEMFTRILDEYKVAHEYYIPPGLDIGASCGQFMMDEYITFNDNVDTFNLMPIYHNTPYFL